MLIKSLGPFYGQVSKALRIISHWLVSLLVTTKFARWLVQHWSTKILPTQAHRIEVNGLVPAKLWPSPLAGVHRSDRTGMFVRLYKTWPTSRWMDQAQYGPFSNRSRLQRTSSWVPGGAISHFGLFIIRMLFGEKKWLWQGKNIFSHFLVLHFLNYLNVFSHIVISIMAQCIPKLSLKKFYFFLYNI